MERTIERLLAGYEGGRITRRELVATLAAVALGAREAGARPEDGRRPDQGPPFRARSLNHTTLFVSDVERSVEFYQRIFGMPVQSRQANGVNLAAGSGNQFLGLYEAGEGTDPAIHHVCIGVEGFEAERALDALARRGVEGRIRMRGETAELYFADPDGLTVQIQDVGYCGGGGPLGDEC